jgi:hypothetical protein
LPGRAIVPRGSAVIAKSRFFQYCASDPAMQDRQGFDPEISSFRTAASSLE